MFKNSSVLDVYSAGLKASWVRNKVINHNLSNVDTMGFKRKDVKFEEYLNNAIKQNGRLDKKVEPRVYTDKTSVSYRLDGNNVNVDTEMMYLAENQLRYNTIVSQVNYNFRRIKSVMNK